MNKKFTITEEEYLQTTKEILSLINDDIDFRNWILDQMDMSDDFWNELLECDPLKMEGE